jgi:hypothetical protein
MEEDELVNIKISIDKSISVNMEIKKEMNSMEFLGLMTKAKKLFNISDDTDKLVGSNVVSSRVSWTPEADKIVMDNYGKKSNQEISDMIDMPGMSASKIKVRMYLLKSKNKNKPVDPDLLKPLQNKGAHYYTPSEIDIIKKMYNSGDKQKEIAAKIGVSLQSIRDKIKNLKLKGVFK